MSIILNVEKLKEKIEKEQVMIIDVRVKDEAFTTGEAAYEHSHIPKAVFLDFKADLSGKGTFLPDVEALARKLGNLGVTNDTAIVFYDEGNHRAASKAWFIMDYIGHEHVFILDGGFPAWNNAGGKVTNEIPQNTKVNYQLNERADLVLHIDDMKQRLDKEQSVLIDSRGYKRYTGEVEPKYKKAGHIPGAVNYESGQVFNEAGHWKTRQALEKHFDSLQEKEEIIVSCGSGNSACMNLVALKEAGFDQVKIYPGGFSEWIEDDENEVEQGNQ